MSIKQYNDLSWHHNIWMDGDVFMLHVTDSSLICQASPLSVSVSAPRCYFHSNSFCDLIFSESLESGINIQRCSVGKFVCVESSRVMFSALNKLRESGTLSLFQHKCNRMLISVLTVCVSRRRIRGCVQELYRHSGHFPTDPFLNLSSVTFMESKSFQFLGLTSKTIVT